MRYIYLFLGILIAILPLLSCEQDHVHEEEDNTVPVLQIMEPTDNQDYNSGDTVWIKGLLTDNELHELNLDILRKSDSISLYHEVISVHELSSYNIKSFWKSSVMDTTDAVLVLKAWDHKPNIVEKRINITINN